MRRCTCWCAIFGLVVSAACSDGGTGPRDPQVNATGRVFTIDGAAPTGLQISVTSLAGTRSATIAADGSFQLRAPVAGDSVDYVIDVASGPRTYHPVLIRAAASSTPDLRIVLVPRRWTIDRGPYSGTAVSISVNDAFRPPCTTAGDANCDGFYPQVWTEGLKLWPAAALPIRVAFDRARSHHAITAVDSAAYWNIVQRMNDDFGTPLFRPARYDELTVAPDGRPDRAVLVRVDTTIAGFAAWTNWSWDAAGDLVSAVVRPARSSFLRNGSLMTHELLHTQGFKHSCSWTTVMGGYGTPQCASTAGLSAGDVAHANVALRVRDLQRSSGAPHGLIAALQGERKVLLGLPPLAAPSLPAGLLLRRTAGIGELLRSDHAH
jgi:hypothetical protein